MRILLIGPPGAGKGTQAGRLAAHLKIPRITTGDLFRQAVQNKTPLGLKVQSYLEKGALVPDKLVLGLMEERMAKPDCKEGFILDGFPRTVGQAEGLGEWMLQREMLLDHVFVLTVPEEEVVLRISGRRQCSDCGAVYHTRYHAPKKEGVCDTCSGKIVQRKDDEEGTIRHRLKVYAQETSPLIRFYEQKGLLKKVDGYQNPEAVFKNIGSLIK